MSETFHQLIWTASFDFQMLGDETDFGVFLPIPRLFRSKMMIV